MKNLMENVEIFQKNQFFGQEKICFICNIIFGGSVSELESFLLPEQPKNCQMSGETWFCEVLNF